MDLRIITTFLIYERKSMEIPGGIVFILESNPISPTGNSPPDKWTNTSRNKAGGPVCHWLAQASCFITNTIFYLVTSFS
jgi:hypothetical protein